MKIKSVFKDYEIDIQNNIDETFIELQTRNDTFFVIDNKVYGLYKYLFNNIEDKRLLLIDAIEPNKNIESVLSVCEQMLNMDSKRNTVLVSIGGGIIQDITGLVANILYRGVKWIYIPTTLLAMCDSCIGGKSSLNFKNYKNMLGSFYPPDQILIYLDFINTLSLQDYYSGLGEVFKFNIIAGKTGLSSLKENMESLLTRNVNVLNEFVLKSLEFKKQYIEEDEFDKGKRIFLNFAHTFGHAYETSSSYQIPHGTAVVLGMITANYISLQRNLLEKNTVSLIEDLCKNIISIELKKEWFDLELIISSIKKDKKQTDASIKAILLNNDFALTIHNDIAKDEISNALDYILKWGGGNYVNYTLLIKFVLFKIVYKPIYYNRIYK